MDSTSKRWLAPTLAAVLALATFAAFAGVGANEFLQLDDPTYVRDNEFVKRGFSAEGWAYAWTSTDAANWHPLTWLSHMLDVELFGVDPGPHHLANLALHGVNALLAFALFLRWTAKPFTAFLAVGLFALHPLRVESVAWTAERKDVLSTLLFFLALHAWTAWVRRPGAAAYAATATCLALGLLAKPMLVTFPCLLLVLDLWPFARLGRGARALVVEKLPFFVLAAASCVATYVAQHAWGAVMTTEELGLAERAANALVSYVRYVRLCVWPSGLAIYYPLGRHTEPALALGAAVALAAATWWCWKSRARAPWRLAGWLWFLGMLVPVIGIVQVGDQALADRYTYLPAIGLAFAVVVELDARVEHGRALLAAAALAILVLLAWRTREQVRLWKDTLTVFTHAALVTKDNAMAHQHIGTALLLTGDVDGAIRELSECVRIAPAFPDAQNNLGSALGARGRFVEAIRCFETAIAVKQDSSRVRTNLGWALFQLGRAEDAERECKKGVELDPNDAQARERLGVVLAASRRTEDALVELRRAVELDSRSVEHRRALALAPDDVESLKTRAWLRATSFDGSVRDARSALELAERAAKLAQANDARTHDVLGAARAAAGEFEAAIGSASRAVELHRAQAKDAKAADVERRIELYRARTPVVRRVPASK
ncbi:MAG: tetratricopeptide repeat protein [Planctomycetes bacterium]|nr:tetratricopeptide repeat protein [Planctomycetota bacterium]